MGEHTQRVTRDIWDALGQSIFQGSLLERIETVLLKDLGSLEEALLKVRDPPSSESDKRSAYSRGYNDAIEAALAIVREWQR
jgi:hypothetical protein